MRSLYFTTCALLITVCTVNAFPCTHWRNCSYMGCGLNNPNSDYDDYWCRDGRCIWQCAEAHGLSDSPLCVHDCPEPPCSITADCNYTGCGWNNPNPSTKTYACVDAQCLWSCALSAIDFLTCAHICPPRPPSTTPTPPSSTPFPPTSCSSYAGCNYTGCGLANPNPTAAYYNCTDSQCQWSCANGTGFQSCAHICPPRPTSPPPRPPQTSPRSSPNNLQMRSRTLISSNRRWVRPCCCYRGTSCSWCCWAGHRSGVSVVQRVKMRPEASDDSGHSGTHHGASSRAHTHFSRAEPVEGGW